uniref:Uncharacterized protein n=1 Tax=Anguilla anguilla TaxID=7936 RepID=A0A0E9TRG2_ANGAN
MACILQYITLFSNSKYFTVIRGKLSSTTTNV